MSQPRSGLVRGLFAGFVAMLVAGVAYSAGSYGFRLLPYNVRWFTGDQRLLAHTVLGLVIAVLIWLALWLTRPRSLLVPVLAALFAFGARTIGSMGSELGNYVRAGFPWSSLDDRALLIVSELPELFRTSPTLWQGVAIAAVPAFLLTLLRVLRLRRRDRAEAAALAAPSPASPTPEGPATPAPEQFDSFTRSATPAQDSRSAQPAQNPAAAEPAAAGGAPVDHEAFRRPTSGRDATRTAEDGQRLEKDHRAKEGHRAEEDHRGAENHRAKDAHRGAEDRRLAEERSATEERGAFEPLQPPVRRPVPDMFAPPREPGES
ncbi:hypothetical protein ACIBKY_49215 [Nonomuraea sp. NPDC050394]|uniref:hypothetical protein n=1 Tax=Nonomuraea sp. NPDC050394 TaxID=3364363 RepID=UPI0037B0ED1F